MNTFELLVYTKLLIEGMEPEQAKRTVENITEKEIDEFLD